MRSPGLALGRFGWRADSIIYMVERVVADKRFSDGNGHRSQPFWLAEALTLFALNISCRLCSVF